MTKAGGEGRIVQFAQAWFSDRRDSPCPEVGMDLAVQLVLHPYQRLRFAKAGLEMRFTSPAGALRTLTEGHLP